MTAERNTVQITTFGIFSLKYGGKIVSERQSPTESQSWQLLKYLVIHAGRVIGMEELTRELSFSGRVTDAGNTLRVRLRRTRSLLEPLGLGGAKDGLILYGDDRYWINPAYTITTDQQEIDRLALPALARLAAGQGDAGECAGAMCAFGGHYLEHSRNSRWVERIRAHYDDLYLRLWDGCVGRMEDSGDFSPSADVWNNAIRLFPREVPRHERHLRALLRAGLLPEAATYYCRLAATLANLSTELPDFTALMEASGSAAGQPTQ